MRAVQIKIPSDKYRKIVELQRQFGQKGLRVPQWQCLVMIENQNRNNKNDVFSVFGRFKL
jgi:hypothetical protein